MAWDAFSASARTKEEARRRLRAFALGPQSQLPQPAKPDDKQGRSGLAPFGRLDVATNAGVNRAVLQHAVRPLSKRLLSERALQPATDADCDAHGDELRAWPVARAAFVAMLAGCSFA